VLQISSVRFDRKILVFLNTIPAIIVHAAPGMGTTVLQAAALGSLGLGAQPLVMETG
jgi:ABC-type dipeptide/oligopeptide/nickel transport system permease subunit